MIDAFRDELRNAPARFFPARPELDEGCTPPAAMRILTWMFLPRTEMECEKKLTQTFTQVVLRILNVPQVD